MVGDSAGRIVTMTPPLEERLGRTRGSLNDLIAMPRALTERRWRDFAERGWWRGLMTLRARSGDIWESEATSWALPDRRWMTRVELVDKPDSEVAS